MANIVKSSGEVMRFRKSDRLLKRHEFQALSSKGHTFYGHLLVIHYKRCLQPRIRLGITITTKFGIAPLRNRFKRVVREAFRLEPKPEGLFLDIVVRPRQKFERITIKEIRADLHKFYSSMKPHGTAPKSE